MIRKFGKNVDMTTGVVWRQLLLFALPLIAGDFLQQLYSTADSVIVGQFVGKTALAAVTSTETLINSVIGMFSGVSAGATVVIARYFGAKDDENIQKAVHTVATITIVMGILMTAVGVGLSPALLRLLKTPEDVFPEAKSYLRIYFCGMMGLVFYNMGSGVLRAVGDSFRPLVALGITSVVNIVLDLLFVAVLDMGVAGASYATILAVYASAAYLLYLLLRADGAYRPSFRKLSYDKKIAGTVFGIGVPMGIQKSIVAFSNLMVIAHINLFGSGASAGWGVFRKVDTLVMNIMSNLGQALSTFISQNLGARKEDRIKSGTRFAFAFTFLCALILDLLLMVLRKPIILLFNSDPDVLHYGSLIFLSMLPFQPLNGLSSVLAGKFRGYGDSKGSTIMHITCMVVLRQIYLNVGWTMTQEFLFVTSCYPFAWVTNLCLHLIYNRVKYKKRPEQGNRS